MHSSESLSEFVVSDIYPYDTRSPGRWIISHVLRHKWFIVTFLIGAFCNGAGAATIPTLVGMAFNTILKPQPDLNIIAGLAVAAFVSQVLRATLQFMRNASAEVLGQRMERDTRQELYASLLGKSMTFHSMQAVGDIMARATNDVHELNLMLNPGMNMVVGSAMFILFPLLLSPAINPQLILTPVLFTSGYILAVGIYTRQLHPATEAVRARFGDMNAGLAEAIDGIETVKGAAQEYTEIRRFDDSATEFRNAFVQQSNIEARFIPLLLLGIAIGTAFVHALILFEAGQITVGNVVTYMGYMSLYGFPVFTSLFGYSNLSLGLAAARRILPLILAKTRLDENREGYQAPIEGAVRFENVSFTYPGGTPALQNVTFEARPGQVIALVGQTGAGKSTLIKLINRTYDTTGGRVLVDGVDVRDWRLEALRSQISIIEQDIFLFSRTVAENIAFGMPGATQEQIEQAAHEAQAHAFIMSFKDGYQTEVGDRGVMLSGGQRQRIALARAFLTSPHILILDDSTSAIDSATEDQIQRAIQRATQGRTTFLITHRLSQIRWADQIIVLRKGRIAACGTHEELLRTSEPYRRIFATDEVTAQGAKPPSGNGRLHRLQPGR
jgi:ATP-binding cassette subfamily B protein